MEKLRVEALFASSPFYLRYESVLTPFLRIGEKWDLHGSCKGLTTVLYWKNYVKTIRNLMFPVIFANNFVSLQP